MPSQTRDVPNEITDTMTSEASKNFSELIFKYNTEINISPEEKLIMLPKHTFKLISLFQT